MGALVPDKGADILIEAYSSVDTDLPLIVVGDSPFAASYRQELAEAADRDQRVEMLGFVYGDRYRELVAHAGVYAHPLRSDGTSPALLQAMGFGSCIVVNSLPETLSAVGDAALPYSRNDPADLARKLEHVLSDRSLADELGQRARRRAEEEFNWDQVAEAHAEVF